jgi:blue copper oxidase
MKRREFIKHTGLSVITTWAGSSLLLSACHTEEDMIGEPNWIVEGSFTQPIFKPVVVEGNTQLNVQTTTGQILNGSSSSILSYRNGLLGNTIKATRGETVSVQVQNNLREETNIHWHGLIVPEDMDGHPKDLIAAGGVIHLYPSNQSTGWNVLVSSPSTRSYCTASVHGVGRNVYCDGQ